MFNPKNEKNQDTKKVSSTAIALGVVFGIIVGVLTDNIGLWHPTGIVIGVAMAATQSCMQK